jgi:hypothetical protein
MLWCARGAGCAVTDQVVAIEAPLTMLEYMQLSTESAASTTEEAATVTTSSAVAHYSA